MVYQLYDVVMMQKPSINPKYLTAVLCWGLPLLVSVLPLCTDKYGIYSYGKDESDEGYCGIVHRSNSPEWTADFWNLVFDTIVLASLIISAVLLVKIRRRVIGSNLQFLSSYVQMALEKLKYYPFITILCWSTQVYLDISVTLFPRETALYPEALLSTSDIIILSEGFLTAIAFWKTNKEIRLMWLHLIQKQLFCVTDTNLTQRLSKYTIHWEETDASSRAVSCCTNPLSADDYDEDKKIKEDSFLVSRLLENAEQVS